MRMTEIIDYKGNKEDVALLLDLDGTLIDSKDKLARDVQATFRLLGKNISPEDVCNGDWELVAKKYGFSPGKFWDAFSKAREPWGVSLRNGRVKLYEDTVPTLDILTSSGYRNLALVTRSEPKETQEKVEHFNLRPYFRTIKVTPTSIREFPRKTKQAIEALEEMKDRERKFKHVYVIGDSQDDDIATAAELRDKLGQDRIKIEGVYVNRENKQLNGGVEREIKNLASLLEILRRDQNGA